MSENGKIRNWFKDFATPLAIIITGGLIASFISYSQISNAEKIADKDRELQIWELFAQEANDTTGIKSSYISLLFYISKYSVDGLSKSLADSLFRASLDYYISRLQSPEKSERIIGGSIIEQIFYLDDKLITNLLVNETIMKDIDESVQTNKDIVLLLRWYSKCELTNKQYNRLTKLLEHRAFIEGSKYGDYLQTVLSRKLG